MPDTDMTRACWHERCVSDAHGEHQFHTDSIGAQFDDDGAPADDEGSTWQAAQDSGVFRGWN